MEENAPLPHQLTDREKAILMRLSSGLTDQQIAADLFLSHNTIRWYNRQIYSKLGVNNRTQAIAQARALGLLEPEHTSTFPPVQAGHQPSTIDRKKARQRVHFATSFDGTRIAYSVTGEGPPLVRTATYMGHQEYESESLIYRHWITELAREHTLIRYDERGTGLSDRDVQDLSFEAWVHDLAAVVEATGVERFPLFAISQGGTVAVAYAVRYPEKVSHLILFGAYARGWLNRDLTPEQIEEERILISAIKIGWGRDNPAFRQVFATNLIPDGSPELIAELANLMRISTSAKNAVRLETMMHHTDVQELARQVKAPTLVLHSIDDQAVPFEEGRLLASLIPGAEFIALDSKNHLLREDEPAWTKFVAAFRGFLGSDDG